MIKDIKNATDNELRLILLTADGLGKKAKEECLEEILKRVEARKKVLEDALKDICKIGANPMTQYGYGVEKPWSRLADDIWNISKEALKND